MSFGLYDDGYMGKSAREHFEARERDRKLETLRGDCRTEKEKVEYKKRYCASCWYFCKHPKPHRSHCECGCCPRRRRMIQSGRVRACEFWDSCIEMDEICKQNNPKYRLHKNRMLAWCDTKKPLLAKEANGG